MVTVFISLLKAGLILPKTMRFATQLSAIVTSNYTRLQQWISESDVYVVRITIYETHTNFKHSEALNTVAAV